ncbi:AlpA family phage regulatory protein [Marinomonas rhizomae]|uniref:AlpA family transcriptional regulator n=1 Tax=Marinomonas rhizomae TaxID=491948 RepID=A0A366J9X1_9GAMM|nr:AlpA family phage regulatory protein [Marinomonas rhizomae]RBP83045.1 AlpA family transcriptional regulator [Marinomonas rhizomae]RNF72650.1 AlpA family phage regulatory protein [Marinomonas rhizomae]
MQSTPFIVDRREVERLTSLRKTTIYRLIREGKFPKPVRISSMRVAWRMKDIEEWIESLDPANTLIA